MPILLKITSIALLASAFLILVIEPMVETLRVQRFLNIIECLLTAVVFVAMALFILGI